MADTVAESFDDLHKWIEDFGGKTMIYRGVRDLSSEPARSFPRISLTVVHFRGRRGPRQSTAENSSWSVVADIETQGRWGRRAKSQAGAGAWSGGWRPAEDRTAPATF